MADVREYPSWTATSRYSRLLRIQSRSTGSLLSQRNLAENGGSLDEVKFLARTNDIEDLNWLDELVTTSDSYSRVDLTEAGQDASNVNYGKVWDVAEPGVMYVKIDDDVVCTCSNPLSSVSYSLSWHLLSKARITLHSQRRSPYRKHLRRTPRTAI